ncbi:hypothetical protein DM860_000897 [Cuscuta australis]|uniref:RRM domain-containing protein n=1 Tax=Cuscuta australis TaxID=267555 RepID=A0A328DS96_9ASTE|nr:hypothetical protein DM860_000897 [Cuscuta australis]
MSSEEASATILIRHLPEAIPPETLSRLFSHYGASSVRPCTHGSVKNCAFVDFKDEALAFQAQRQLNGLRFLGKILSVERANKQSEADKLPPSAPGTGKDSITLIKDSASYKDLDGSSLSYCRNEPISERLGVDYPFPPHLEYAYPPPDGHILTNIVNALIAVPRFYTQVLHLMNKMNIPAPFRTALPTPPLPTPPSFTPQPPPPPPPTDTGTRADSLLSSESEMESSDEETPRVGGIKRKRMKREAIVGPAANKDVAHEAVGLKPAVLLPKEMPIVKKKNPVLQIKIAPKQVHSELINDDSISEVHREDELTLDNKAVLTIEELKSGKLVPEEILSLPVFKNYSVGNPSCVLYIKNLSRDVIPDDFYFIFGSFFGSIDAARSNLTVKLMQEGRMRGQAFITFPTVELAQNALNLVNGYVFKGKPIVIQFGRNAAATTG